MSQDPIAVVRAASPGDLVELHLTPSDIEALARAYLSRKPDLDFRDLSIELKPPAILIRGETNLLGRGVRVSVQGIPTVKDRQVRIDIRGITLNDSPAPKFAASEIAGFLQERFTPEKLLLHVDEITVNDDSVHVVATRAGAPGLVEAPDRR